MRRPDVFEYFFVCNPATQQLLYSSKPGLLLGNLTAKPPAWLRDTTGLRTGKTAEITIQGQAFHLFAQPLRLATGTDWLLCGAVPIAQFNQERYSVSSSTLEVSLSLLLLGLLAMPFLKLAFMSAHERLNRLDVFLCAASLVLGSGLIVLGMQSFVMRHWLERNALEGQLRTLSNAVKSNLAQELAELDTTLQLADACLERKLPMWHVTDTLPGILEDTLSATQQFRPKQRRGSSDLFLWIDAQGESRLALGQTKEQLPDYLTNLRSRLYFQAVQQLTYPDSTSQEPYYFSSIISYKDAGVTAVVARASRWPSLKSNGTNVLPGACILTTDLRCLSRPVLPPGYSFCLIDEKGEVLFHSDERLTLSENLLKDAGPSAELQAAIFAHDITFTKGDYQGRNSLLYLQPLPITNRYLVTVADLDVVQAWQLQTLSEAAGLLTVFWLLLALFAALLRVTAPRARDILPVHQSFQRLWPRRNYANRYARLTAALLLALLGITITVLFVPPLTQLFVLLATPLYLYWLAYKLLPMERETPRQIIVWKVTLVAALLVLNLYFGQLLGLRQLSIGVAFQIVLVLLLMPIASEWPQRLRKRIPYHSRFPRLTYRFYYSSMLLGWVLLLGIVPSFCCYQIANGVERMYQIRYAHLSLLQQLGPTRFVDLELREKLFDVFLTDQLVTLKSLAWPLGTPFLRFQVSLPSKKPSAQKPNEYASFFFGTAISDNPPRLPSEQSLTWAKQGYTIIPNRRFYGLLHHSFSTNAIGTRQALPVYADDSVQLSLWRVARKPALYASRNNMRYRHWLVSETDAHPTLQWLLGPVHSVNKWLQSSWLLLLPGLLYLLYRLIRYSTRWIFAPTVFTHRDLDLPLQPSAHAQPALHRFLLTPAASTLAGLPKPLCQTLPLQPALAILDCQTIPTAAAASLPNWLKTHVSSTAMLVALEQFECEPLNADRTERKRATIELLISQGKRVLILSRVHPAAFADCGHSLERDCQAPGHKRIREAGNALLDSLAYFQIEYLPLQSYTARTAPYHVWREWHLGSRTLLREECSSLPFLRRLYPALCRSLQQRWLTGQRLDSDNIVLAVQRMAQFYYRSLWRMLGPQEQFLLFDLAQDGLVNPRSVLALDTLLQKGYVQVNRYGRLQIFNRSFRSYILSSVKNRQALRFEQEDPQESTWSAVHLPLLLLLTSGALFIFVTQRAVMTQAQQFLTAFVTLLPLLSRLFTSSSFFSGNTAKPEAKT
ncbi:hypothetical protein BXP70_01360 [Hymenobacter crusticola]|uniref:Cache domain-containing protein n=1 Tax=Hymenobacter crusticola TaxID=1770526 RepID=A0A243WK25_9BACT|nr:hypothetical protein BXP70_01360 [Hymenobacter crusticola]